MTTEPKLTEAQAIEMWNQAQKSAPATFIKIFRECGLIAEEPDAIHRLAAEICAKLLGTGSSAAMVKEVEGMIRRRGLELAPRKELTREMVEEMTTPYTFTVEKTPAGFVAYLGDYDPAAPVAYGPSPADAIIDWCQMWGAALFLEGVM